MLEMDRLDGGVTVKVLFAFEIDGEEDICTQALKLSKEI